MSEPFLGQIKMFAGNFAPVGWAFCHGQLVSTRDNEALFSLLGTIYGGDGRTTFALPDLRGRIPIQFGQGIGLPNYNIGAKAGTETVNMTVSQMSAHNHGHVRALEALGTAVTPAGNVTAEDSNSINIYAPDNAATATTIASEAVSSVGGGASIDNVMPFLCINYIIATVGVYPSRT